MTLSAFTKLFKGDVNIISGGFAAVQKGRGRLIFAAGVLMKRTVAYKSCSTVATPYMRACLEKEAAILERFRTSKRPGVARLLSLVQEDQAPAAQTPPGLVGIVMEWVEGPILRDWLADKSVGVRPRLLAAISLAALMRELQENDKLVHRDLKPSNVMVQMRALATAADMRSTSKTGKTVSQDVTKPSAGADTVSLVLIDFGLARLVHESDAHVSTEHKDAGTPVYASPEQIQGKDVVGTDVYAFGVMLPEFFTGQQWKLSLDQKQKLGEQKFPAFLPKWLVAAIEKIARACMDLDVENRPNFEQIHSDLAELLSV